MLLMVQIGFKLDPSMFSTPEKQQLPLERCMRILPHHQVGCKDVTDVAIDSKLPASGTLSHSDNADRSCSNL